MSNDLRIFYNQPAAQWPDAFPIGNGRLGAMVYGGARVERIFLSDGSFWSGEPSPENNNPDGPQVVAEVRRLLLAGDIAAANLLAEQIEGRKHNYGTNLPFGNLRLWMAHPDADEGRYRRQLDLDTAIAGVDYVVTTSGQDEMSCRREAFASHADGLLVVRLGCSRPGGVSLRAGLDGDEQPHTTQVKGQDSLTMQVMAREHVHSDGASGVMGHAHLLVRAEGGRLHSSGSHIVVENADAVTLLLAFASSLYDADPAATCRALVEAAAAAPYTTLKERHIADHQALFRRAALDLGPALHPEQPLDERVAAARQGMDDPALAALLFQFGRYLLIGSSRPDSPLPAHLTGVWNDNVACRIGWTCDYHLDINTQMNYWIAELTNLPECHAPLLHYIENTLVPSGRRTAATLYGLGGWVAHIFSNPWGFTAPGWSIWWGLHPTGGAWVATHLWDHYLFNGDLDFLAHHAYPVLKEAAEFFLDYLFEDPQTGRLLSGPSNSPENTFLFAGRPFPVALAPTADRVLIDELFAEVIEAGELLGLDEDLRRRLAAARTKLPPFQVGKHGQLQEWLEDYDEAMPHHRHTSHLLGLFPYAQITPDNTVLAQAVRVSIARREAAPYEEGSWGRNLLTLYQARLGDGEAAYASLRTLYRAEGDASLMMGTNLAPRNAYEMDYNTGATAGIAEMLLQSHRGYLHLLPALPQAWQTGQVRGLCGRGGFVVDMEWKDNTVSSLRVLARCGGICKVRCTRTLMVKHAGQPVTTSELAAGVIQFETTAGETYELR